MLKMYREGVPVFGPKFKGLPVQKGEGLGSLFGGLFRKVLPLAAKGLKTAAAVGKKVAKSKLVKDTGRKILDHALEAGTQIAADAIEGTGADPRETAKDRLNAARKDIADVIRKRAVLTDTDTDESDNEKVIKSKKKKRKSKLKKKGKKYSLFNDGN